MFNSIQHAILQAGAPRVGAELTCRGGLANFILAVSKLDAISMHYVSVATLLSFIAEHMVALPIR